MNAYVTLDYLKSAGILNITGTGDDTRIRRLIEDVSRIVDRYCNRHFYALAVTRKFDGDGGLTLLIPDLISVDSSGLKTDDDKDRTFETTWATTDYLLLPSNADPTTRENPESRPYWKVWVDVDAGNEDVWTVGVQTVEIAGQWGYWRHLLRATETMDEITSATATSVVVSSRADVEAGHTLLLDSEQMYVQSYSTNTLTVVRGVNGTTAATHAAATVIDIYEYPAAVQEATLIQASRLLKRKDTAFASSSGFPDGSFQSFKAMDPEAKEMLGPLKKWATGVGV